MYRFHFNNPVIMTVIILLSVVLFTAESSAWNSFLGDNEHSLISDIELTDYFSLDFKLNLGTSFLSSPVIDNNIIYTGGKNGILYAIDLETESIVWFYRTDGPVLSTPCVYGEFIYFGSNDGNFYSLRKSDGIVNFIYDAESPVASSPAVSGNNIVFTTSLTNKLLCLNSLTGDKVWEYDIKQPSQSSPLVYNNRIYTGVNNGNLVCVNALNGDEIFKFATAGNAGFHSPCLLGTDTILFAPGILDKNLYGISALTGNELWKYSGSINPSASPAKYNRRLGLSHLARLPQLKKSDKNEETTRNFFPGLEKSYFIAPVDPNLVYSSNGTAADDENIYFVTGYPESHLVAISRLDHEFKWNFSLGIFSENIGFYTSPVTDNRRVYITNSNGEFIVLDRTNGAKISTLYISSYVYSVPAIHENRIVLTTKNGSIIVLKEKSAPTGNDVIPPQITDVTPVSGSTIITNKPVFSARFFEEESGILYSKIKFRINGENKPFTFNAVDSKIRYTPYYPLDNGLYTVFLEVQDGSGNIKNHVWSFTINYSEDVTAPVMNILTPSSNEMITDTKFPEISAHIFETGGSGISLSNVSMKLDSEFVPYFYDANSGIISFSPESPLSNGEHSVTVNSCDTAGNNAAPLQWKFTLNFSGDNTPPSIIPVFPLEDYTVVSTRKPEIKIRLEDSSRLNSKSLSLKLDNEIVDFTFDEETGLLTFTPSDYLSEGIHNLSVTALDLPGNVANKSWNFSVQLDLKPVLTRLTNIFSDSCTINWMTNPQSIGKIKLSENEDMSSSQIYYDSRGIDFKTVFHSVKLENLTDDKTMYFQIITEAEGSSLTTSEIFEFIPTGSISSYSNIIDGKILDNGSAIDNSVVFLTVEDSGVFSRPLSTLTDINGDFEFPVNQFLTLEGGIFPLTNNSILRISAYDNKNSSAYLTSPVTDISTDINVGSITLNSTIQYRYTLKYGLNPVSVFLKNSSAMTAFELLNNNNTIKEIYRFDSTTHLYSSAIKLFGEAVGTDFIISPNEGIFMNVNKECEINIIGTITDKNESVNLSKGLNLVGIPGGNELPDNPVSKFSSKEFLENNNDVNVISSFDINKQFFVSSFILDDIPRGDEFYLRYDKAYFISAVNSSTLNTTTVKNLTPVKYSPAKIRKSPSRIISETLKTSKKKKMILPPSVITGKISIDKRGIKGLNLQISILTEQVSSEKYTVVTDRDGFYSFNLANFQNINFNGNIEDSQIKIEFIFNNKSHSFKRKLSPDNLIVLEEYLLEEVMN